MTTAGVTNRAALKVMQFLLDGETMQQRKAAEEELERRRRAPTEEEEVGSIRDVVGGTTDGPDPTDGVRLSDGIFEDVEMFAAASGDTRLQGAPSCASSSAAFECAFDAVCHGHGGIAREAPIPRGTKHMLRRLINRPCGDPATLRKRGEELTRLASAVTRQHPDRWQRYVQASRDMARLEADVLWVFRGPDETSGALYEMAYFSPWLMGLPDRVPVALTALNVYKIVALPLMGALTPVIFFIVPYVVLRWKIGLPISFRTYLWILYRSFVTGDMLNIGTSASTGGAGGAKWTKHVSLALALLFYFQSVFTSIEVARALRIVCGCIDSRMRNVSLFFKRAAEAV